MSRNHRTPSHLTVAEQRILLGLLLFNLILGIVLLDRLWVAVR